MRALLIAFAFALFAAPASADTLSILVLGDGFSGSGVKQGEALKKALAWIPGVRADRDQAHTVPLSSGSWRKLVSFVEKQGYLEPWDVLVLSLGRGDHGRVRKESESGLGAAIPPAKAEAEYRARLEELLDKARLARVEVLMTEAAPADSSHKVKKTDLEPGPVLEAVCATRDDCTYLPFWSLPADELAIEGIVGRIQERLMSQLEQAREQREAGGAGAAP